MFMRERSLEEEKYQRRKRTPSFSSSLLDSIYRSIDESNGKEGDPGYVRESKKQSNSGSKRENRGVGERTNLRRAMMIENWIEKQSVHGSMFSNSGSSSSDSSSGAAFSSSDQTESSYKTRRSSKQSPVVISEKLEKPKHESNGGFSKTKLRALKIYGELKKVKQPISPGGKIASFINSIFSSAGNAKKSKMCYVGAVEDVTTTTSENIAKSNYSSSASTFSRSCLSKPSSSRSKKSSNGGKRSVRFYPVSVILGEDDTHLSSHNKCVYEEDPSLLPRPSFQNFARTPGQNYPRGFCENGDGDNESDAESYSSSDLFELDQPVGIGRYTEELPVYETTNFRTNLAIAKGLIL